MDFILIIPAIITRSLPALIIYSNNLGLILYGLISMAGPGKAGSGSVSVQWGEEEEMIGLSQSAVDSRQYTVYSRQSAVSS